MEGHARYSKIGENFGVGIVGLGEGKGLLKGLDGHPELKVSGICDSNLELIKEQQTFFKIPFITTEINELVKREDIDIVAIFTPDNLHISHIRTCFEAGKHVICTKPLVATREEALEVLELKKKYPKLQLMVGQSSRFFGSMQYQRKEFEAGKLGELSFAETQYVHDMRWFYNNRPWAREKDFDMLFACAAHPVDLIRWYMGDVEEVHAYGAQSLIAKNADFKGMDTYVVNLKFSSGKIGRILGLYGLEHLHQTRPWIEVALYGTKGTYIAKYPQLEAQIKYVGEKEKVEYFFEDIYHYFQYEGVNHHAGEFVNYTEEFALALVNGTVAQPDAEDGYKTIATLEAIRESIHSGKPEKVIYI